MSRARAKKSPSSSDRKSCVYIYIRASAHTCARGFGFSISHNVERPQGLANCPRDKIALIHSPRIFTYFSRWSIYMGCPREMRRCYRELKESLVTYIQCVCVYIYLNIFSLSAKLVKRRSTIRGDNENLR